MFFPFVVQFFSGPAVHASVTIGDQQGAHLIQLFFAGVIGLSMLLGVGLGITALFGIPRYGTKGILIKALFGILLPVLLVLISIPVMIHAQERAAQIQAAQQGG